MKIENAIALVTGANRGIGYALVEALLGCLTGIKHLSLSALLLAKRCKRLRSYGRSHDPLFR